MRKKLLLIFTITTLALASKAQNLKISQFRNAPMFYNPATAGKFNNARVRISTLYSNQKTDSANLNHALVSADYNLERENGSWGVGVTAYLNYHPEFCLSGKYLSATIARHLYLDYDQHHMISGGVQVAYALGQMDMDRPVYNDKIAGGGFRILSNRAPTSRRAGYKDVNMGGMYTYKDETITIETGLGLYHVLSPVQTINKVKVHQPRRLDITANATIAIDDNNEIELSTMMWREGLSYGVTKEEAPLIENIYGVSVESFIGETTAIYYGLSTRSAYTINPVAGISFNNNAVRLKASYEAPINKGMYEVSRAEFAAIVSF